MLQEHVCRAGAPGAWSRANISQKPAPMANQLWDYFTRYWKETKLYQNLKQTNQVQFILTVSPSAVKMSKM